MQEIQDLQQIESTAPPNVLSPGATSSVIGEEGAKERGMNRAALSIAELGTSKRRIIITQRSLCNFDLATESCSSGHASSV